MVRGIGLWWTGYGDLVCCIKASNFPLFVGPFSGIGMLVLGSIVARIYTELMLIMFEIHGELKKLNNK